MPRVSVDTRHLAQAATSFSDEYDRFLQPASSDHRFTWEPRGRIVHRAVTRICHHARMATISIPLFPLSTVLFPDGVLPLQIFEVRYLDMISRCLTDDEPFGVVLLTHGQEVRAPEGLERF